MNYEHTYELISEAIDYATDARNVLKWAHRPLKKGPAPSQVPLAAKRLTQATFTTLQALAEISGGDDGHAKD